MTQYSNEAIEAVIKEVICSLDGALTPATLKLYAEVESLASFVQNAKMEIAAIQPGEIRTSHIPLATDELDAVVSSTEQATGVILDQAERLDRVMPLLVAPMDADTTHKVKETLQASVTAIYEACNFQDITGQRITKVVRALREIDAMLQRMVSIFGSEVQKIKGESSAPEAPKSAAPQSDASLLNGPQLPQDANDQSAIDALFNSP